MADHILITANGLKKLESEIQRLTSERSVIVKAIEAARALGDLSENADYDAAKNAQAINAGRLTVLQDLYAKSKVIERNGIGDGSVAFGLTVELHNLHTDENVVYTIVSAYEASIEQGLLSVDSPLAKALLGKKKDDIVQIHLPKGDRSYRIIEVRD